ncbi:MAG: IS4 family transposase [Verrucomicrobiota bacterium]
MTPFFPQFTHLFASHLRSIQSSSASSIHQLAALFDRWIPAHLLSQADDGPHSRQRRWPFRLAFWTASWQFAQPGATCRTAIRQAQAWCLQSNQTPPPSETSPYCQARAALPLERLQQIHDHLVREADQALATKDLWCSRRVQVIDSTTLCAADTAPNQAAFPQQSVQKPGCGFPILRLLAVMSLSTGMIVAWTKESLRSQELGLLQRLWEHFRKGDILLGDRGFACWGLLAQCQMRGVDAVFRVRGKLRSDFRQGRELDQFQRVVIWEKPKQKPRTVNDGEWRQLPQSLTLRLVRCRVENRGFRSCDVILVTTLLDTVSYPVIELGRLYRRRWLMELCLRNLKTTLGMEMLSAMNPENLDRELRLHLLVHNMVRRLMLETARQRGVALGQISFAGSVAAALEFSQAICSARSRKMRERIFRELLSILANDPVPIRPDRREPRALKRRPKPYQLLNCHRRLFQEIRHQNRYRKAASPKNTPKTLAAI